MEGRKETEREAGRVLQNPPSPSRHPPRATEPNAEFDKLAFFVGGVVRLLTLLPSFFHADACLAKHPIRL